MPRLPIAAIVAGLIALLIPAPVQAARIKVSSEEPRSAPHLAGDQVVYVQYTGAANLVRAASPNTPPHTLRTFGVGGGDEDCCFSFVEVGLDTSVTRLATLTYVQ